MTSKTTRNDDFVLSVTDLLHRPGATRQVDLSMGVPDELALTLVEVWDPLRLAGVIESVVDGLIVRGRVEADVRLSCARCLRAIEQRVRADVAELFTDPTAPSGPGGGRADDAEVDVGYEIHDGTIDLETLLRDALVPAAPYQPLCKPDCAGLCPSCGANRNDAVCDCGETPDDPRWAALQGLQLPPDTPGS